MKEIKVYKIEGNHINLKEKDAPNDNEAQFNQMNSVSYLDENSPEDNKPSRTNGMNHTLSNNVVSFRLAS